MKRVFALILALLYLGTSTGASVHVHYCMDKLANWGLNTEKSLTCAKCSMDKSNEKEAGCCKDEHKFIKNNVDHKVVQSSFEFIKMLATVQLSTYDESPALHLSSVTEENPSSNAPPRSSKTAVYILKRSFLI